MESQRSPRQLNTKRSLSLPPDTRLGKIPRVKIDSDESESNSSRQSSVNCLEDHYHTDAESGFCDVNDVEIDGDASQLMSLALCNKCESISLDAMIIRDAKNMMASKYKDRIGYRLHDDLYDLGDSALRGCRLCQIILIEAKRYLQRPDTETYHTLLKGLYDDGGLSGLPVFIRLSSQAAHFCGTFEIHIPYGGDSTTIASLEVEARSQDQLPFSNVGRPCQYDLGSPLALAFMRDSFQECSEKHVDCKLNICNLPTLPTRIIDVGNEKSPPRLITGSPNKGGWIALSHCWGGTVNYILTKRNINSRQLGMPLDELPTTFKDAVTITRNLGIKYLWIDAICIIQDSLDEDWPKEASRMREYYMNSVLTISAMNAENSTKGVLQKRLPSFQPLQLSLKSELMAWEGMITIRESHPKLLRFWERSPVSVLTTRGWTFQENCLPPRTLHFTSSGLVWECLSHTAAEWLHDSLNHRSEFKSLIRPYAVDDSNRNDKAQLSAPDTASEKKAREDLEEQIYDSWDKLIRLYSERNLTFASDKLPAISGIASMFGTMLGEDQYIAGLWKSKLLEGLCWNLCSCAKMARSRSDEYRAPSWSWASMDGEIILNHRADISERETHKQSRARILEAQVECEPQNSFGRVRAGMLRLCSLWLPVYLDVFPEWNDEEGPGTFYFVLQEIDRKQIQSGAHQNLWGGHVKTQWLDILHPSNYSCLNSRQGSPESSSSLGDAEASSDTSIDGEDSWQRDAASWTCVPLARLDIAPTSEEFLGATGQFRMGVLMLSDGYFLLLQPNKHSPETFVRIGIASASWVSGRRFSDEYVEKNTCEILIT